MLLLVICVVVVYILTVGVVDCVVDFLFCDVGGVGVVVVVGVDVVVDVYVHVGVSVASDVYTVPVVAPIGSADAVVVDSVVGGVLITGVVVGVASWCCRFDLVVVGGGGVDAVVVVGVAVAVVAADHGGDDGVGVADSVNMVVSSGSSSSSSSSSCSRSRS